MAENKGNCKTCRSCRKRKRSTRIFRNLSTGTPRSGCFSPGHHFFLAITLNFTLLIASGVYVIIAYVTELYSYVNSDTEQPEIIISPSEPVNENDIWMLTLVNQENPLDDNYLPKLKSLANGLRFDERAIHHLNAMLAVAKEQGLSIVVSSAHRTIEYQRLLFNNHVLSLTASGLNREQAEKEARKSVAYPGTSEHNLGLAVDLVSNEYQLLDEKQAETPEFKWLIEHCAEYGFILRYPNGKEDITGIKYEPWHFRYVGEKAAREIMNKSLSLEEYLLGE